MKYTLVWRQSAFQDLATLWIDAPSPLRERIRRAVDDVEAALQRYPHGVGESRTGNERLVVELPVAMMFEISDDDRQVRVLAIQLLE